MELAKTFALFVVTAVAEIVGCYLPYLWLRWDLLGAAVAIAGMAIIMLGPRSS